VDDGSTDGSARLLKKLSGELKFAFLSHEKNLGIAASCNDVLSQASGEYFIVLGDDLLLPDRISGDVLILERFKDVGVVCSQARVIGPDNEIIEDLPKMPRGSKPGRFLQTPLQVWLEGSKVFTPTATYRSSKLRSLGGWDTRFEIEDRPLMIRMAQKKIEIWYRPEVTTYYRRNVRNLSAQFQPGILKRELDLLEVHNISAPPWRIVVKLLTDLHYWMLFLNVGYVEARESLILAGLSNWVWTLNSRIFKLGFIAASFLNKGRIVTRDSKGYMSSSKGSIHL